MLMRFYLENYGCTMNRGEGEEIRQHLLSLGATHVEEPEDADIIILNTCIVIDSTEKRMIHRLDELSAFDKTTVLTGCLPAALPEKVNDYGNKLKVLEFGDIDSMTNILNEANFTRKVEVAPESDWNPITATIPISQGCLGECSYCITKVARGHLKSYDIEQVVGKAREFLGLGAKQLLLTSQDTGTYGVDIGQSLPDLVNNIIDIDKDFMIRIGMMNPASVKDNTHGLIDIYRHRKVYSFIHLPVQSGSDEVLHSMNRRYSTEEFFQLVERMRGAVPGICISTDLIIAFPGESEEDFQASCELVKKVRPDIVNVTRFSARPKTDAAKMDNRVPTDIAKNRSRFMTDLRFEVAFNLNKQYIGSKHRALVTEQGKEKSMIGRIENYKPVVLRQAVELGSWVEIEITDAAPTHLFGELI